MSILGIFKQMLTIALETFGKPSGPAEDLLSCNLHQGGKVA